MSDSVGSEFLYLLFFFVSQVHTGIDNTVERIVPYFLPVMMTDAVNV